MWESLPSLPVSRSWHGCDKLVSDGTKLLVVYGGHNLAGSTKNPFGDILFLDLNKKSRGWFSNPGIQMDKPILFVNGGLVKRLTAGWLYQESKSKLGEGSLHPPKKKSKLY